jgi:phosphatidylinositol alpha-mannosyltransferase
MTTTAREPDLRESMDGRRALRIALVHPHSWPEVRRGGERYLADLAWYLGQNGHTVDVITGTDGPGTTVREAPGVTIHRLHHLTAGSLTRRGIGRDETFAVPAVTRLLRRRYDVVHAFTPTAALAAVAAGQRTVYTVIGHPNPAYLAEHPTQRRIFSAAARAATVTAALSAASARAVREHLGRDAHVLPPGIRLERFPPSLEPRRGPPRLLFSAHLEDRRKGLLDVLGAVPALCAVVPDARVVLSGAGDHRWAVDRLGDAAGDVMRAVDVLGPGALDDVPRRYRDATVTVLPSVDEAFGLAIAESLASGTPAICADSGGPPEIVSTRDVGRVVPAGDVAALAAAMVDTVRLAADPATPRRCVEASRRWGWTESVGPQHESLYRDIATRRRAFVSARARR